MTAYSLVKANSRWYLTNVAPIRSNPAIIMRWRAYHESDKIVTFLTRDFGKLTGIAKGARRSRRRFVNSLESLARVQARFRQRPGTTLAFLESCELLHPPGALTEPVRFAYASYLTELTDRLTVEGNPVPELYTLLEEGLSVLADGPATGSFLRAFELKLLVRAGYEPQFGQCHSCQRDFAPDKHAALELHHGRILCTECGRTERGPTTEVGTNVLSQLTTLKDAPLGHCRHQSLGELDSEAADVSGRLLALHLTRPLNSLKVIAQATAKPKQPVSQPSSDGRAAAGDQSR